MSMPKSVVKFNKDGVKVISNVDRVNYTITELTRRALNDVGNFITRKVRAEMKPVVKKSKRHISGIQKWVRKKETDLWVGFKHDTWYAVQQELGTKNQPRKSYLRNITYDNIEEIRKIEAAYLSAVEDEMKAKALINEDEYKDE